MFKRFIYTTLAFLALAAKGWAADITVTEAYAPKSLTPVATSAAAYLTLSNAGEADMLIGITAPAAAMAMLHESKVVEGVATMDMLHHLEVPAGGHVVMAPGGIHIMLTGLSAPLREGDTLDLELAFAKAGVVKVSVPVTGLAGPAAATSP
jgi:hypothetical protein